MSNYFLLPLPDLIFFRINWVMFSWQVVDDFLSETLKNTLYRIDFLEIIGTRVEIITGSVVALENLFPENYRYRLDS